MESAFCLRMPLYLRILRTFCGFHLHFADSNYILRYSLTVAESRTNSYICLLRNPQQNNCADKIYVTAICTRNPRNFCRLDPLTFCIMFKVLSLESRNIQTENCVPIQCTVWPRNEAMHRTRYACMSIQLQNSPNNFISNCLSKLKLKASYLTSFIFKVIPLTLRSLTLKI